MIAVPVKQETSRSPVVQTVMVALTDDCNLRCGYCFVKKQPRRMTAETAGRVVDFAFRGDVSGRIVQLNFFGGEPFLELDRMEEIVEGALGRLQEAGKGVSFSATTNGTLLSPRIRRLIERARMALLVSLDGGPKVTGRDRPFVSGRNSFEVVARNFPHFLEASPDVTVRTTFHPGAMDLVGRVEWLTALGAPRIVLCPVLELPWLGREAELEQAYLELADWYLAHSSRDGVPPLTITNELLMRWHRALCGVPRPRRPCEVGDTLLGLDPEGNIMPCHRFLYRPYDWLGTLERPEVHSPRRHRYLEIDSSKLVGCDECQARPVCGGGCRVVALERGLGIDGVDPHFCVTMRAHHQAVVRIHQGLLERGWLEAALRRLSSRAVPGAVPH